MKKNKKEKKFDLDLFIKKSKSDKKKYILKKSKLIKHPIKLEKKLQNSYKIKEILNSFIVQYIKKIKENYPEDIKPKIIKEINEFKNNFINTKLPKLINTKPTNLYQMSGATDFAKINIILRSLSTSMGLLWEDLAILSKVAISTEKEFDIKINGIDVIFLKDNKPYYAQIKTLEGTLTGSQVPRSESELNLHENSYFVSAFKTGTPWTFNSKIINKLVGKEFWSLIDLDYDFILEQVKKMILEIQDNYQSSKN